MTTLAPADMKMPSIVGDIFSDAYATLIASIDYIEIIAFYSFVHSRLKLLVFFLFHSN